MWVLQVTGPRPYFAYGQPFMDDLFDLFSNLTHNQNWIIRIKRMVKSLVSACLLAVFMQCSCSKWSHLHVVIWRRTRVVTTAGLSYTVWLQKNTVTEPVLPLSVCLVEVFILKTVQRHIQIIHWQLLNNTHPTSSAAPAPPSIHLSSSPKHHRVLSYILKATGWSCWSSVE